MAIYRVVWSIDLEDEDNGVYDGDTPEVRVARYAQDILKKAANDPESICWAFRVLPQDQAQASNDWPHHACEVVVDLDEMEGRV